MDFIRFKGPFSFFNEMQNGNILLRKAEEEQNKFISNLREITSGNPKHKEEYQLDTIKNVKNIYDSRQNIIDLFNDSAKIRSEAIYETKGTGINRLTPKQMLQRLLVALAQVKADSNSENLLNEIIEIVHSLYQSKQITKKVYNDIIKSIQ